MVHIGVCLLMVGVIVLLNFFGNDSVINVIYMVAGYTYGPLLGMFAFGLFTKYAIRDRFIPIVAILSPILSYFINTYVFDFGFAILIVNGALCFFGLWLVRIPKK